MKKIHTKQTLSELNARILKIQQEIKLISRIPNNPAKNKIWKRIRQTKEMPEIASKY